MLLEIFINTFLYSNDVQLKYMSMYISLCVLIEFADPRLTGSGSDYWDKTAKKIGSKPLAKTVTGSN